jgi:hypothetical protein
VLLALWLACSEGAPAPKPEAVPPPACAQRSAAEVESIGPFAIEVEATSGPGLHAVLRNVSSGYQNALVHEQVQPSRPVLVGADGRELKPRDTRDDKRSALAVVSQSYYTGLAPCETLDLGSATFSHSASGHGLAWGPFQWSKLPSGAYDVSVAVAMRVEHYNDPRGNRRRPEGGVWTGEVTSDAVRIVLP